MNVIQELDEKKVYWNGKVDVNWIKQIAKLWSHFGKQYVDTQRGMCIKVLTFVVGMWCFYFLF